MEKQKVGRVEAEEEEEEKEEEEEGVTLEIYVDAKTKNDTEWIG